MPSTYFSNLCPEDLKLCNPRLYLYFCFVIVLAEHSGCVAVMGLFWVAFLLQSLNRLQVAYTEGQERTTKDK
jgi:hypothetical protein